MKGKVVRKAIEIYQLMVVEEKAYSKEELSEELKVSIRAIQDYFGEINIYLFDRHDYRQILYDRSIKKHVIKAI
ncbi:hypothetical protein KHQ82_03420 [Mycoplasmatota bacterium]|nr:hypothetical protein KHQ82_03420 [Mycoplasmatota bacterium]